MPINIHVFILSINNCYTCYEPGARGLMVLGGKTREEGRADPPVLAPTLGEAPTPKLGRS